MFKNENLENWPMDPVTYATCTSYTCILTVELSVWSCRVLLARLALEGSASVLVHMILYYLFTYYHHDWPLLGLSRFLGRFLLQNRAPFQSNLYHRHSTYSGCWAWSSFCFWRLASLCFSTLDSGTHSSHLPKEEDTDDHYQQQRIKLTFCSSRCSGQKIAVLCLSLESWVPSARGNYG